MRTSTIDPAKSKGSGGPIITTIDFNHVEDRVLAMLKGKRDLLSLMPLSIDPTTGEIHGKTPGSVVSIDRNGRITETLESAPPSPK